MTTMPPNGFSYVYGPQPEPLATTPRSVLFLYCALSTQTRTVQDYLEAFTRHSPNQFFFEHATSFGRSRCPLEQFDAVFVHYSVRQTYIDYMDPEHRAALRAYRGLKVLFIQDEYERTNYTRAAIHDLGFQVVFSVVPPGELAKVYPPEQFPGVTFYSILTGYVPDRLLQWPKRSSCAERPLWFAYRGRPLHPVFGDLAQEKTIIAQRMQEACAARGVPADIEWNETKRIYGDRWFDFLASARATLGTESGANIFDEDGKLHASIEAWTKKQNRAVPYLEVREKFLQGREDRLARMNQISPRMFEAITLRTALVLFEGDYSGVLKPNEHFIPLAKDFSNLDSVFEKLDDTAGIDAMTARAYRDVIESRKYSYEAFVAQVDRALARHAAAPKPMERCLVSVAVRNTDAEPWYVGQTSGLGPTMAPVPWSDLKRFPRFVPGRPETFGALLGLWKATVRETFGFLLLWPHQYLNRWLWKPLLGLHRSLPPSAKEKLIPITDMARRVVQAFVNPA